MSLDSHEFTLVLLELRASPSEHKRQLYDMWRGELSAKMGWTLGEFEQRMIWAQEDVDAERRRARGSR